MVVFVSVNLAERLRNVSDISRDGLRVLEVVLVPVPLCVMLWVWRVGVGSFEKVLVSVSVILPDPSAVKVSEMVVLWVDAVAVTSMVMDRVIDDERVIS